LASTTQAAEFAGTLPVGDQSWTKVELLNTPGEQAYPIVTFSYLLVYRELNAIDSMTQEKATALVQFIWYVVHDGQQHAESLAYAALPSNVVQIDEATIQSITFNGQPLPTS
jgi:ABC-type phosphate transport system substrate-binding protein